MRLRWSEGWLDEQRKWTRWLELVVPEEVGETGPRGMMPSPGAQVEDYGCLLKAMRNHDRILEQKSGISLCRCLSCPAENIDFAACASKMAFIFFHHRGLQKHVCEAP